MAMYRGAGGTWLDGVTWEAGWGQDNVPQGAVGIADAVGVKGAGVVICKTGKRLGTDG